MSSLNLSSPFRRSALELKNVHSLTGMALLTALHLILNLTASVQITPSLKLSFSFLAAALMGMLYGPVCAAIGTGISDIIQAFVHPTGPYFFGFTLTALLAGFLYGCFLYKGKHSLPRLIAVQTLINVFLHVGLNGLWLKIMYGKAFLAMLPVRAAKNLIMLPIEITLMYLVLAVVPKAIHAAGTRRKNGRS